MEARLGIKGFSELQDNMEKLSSVKSSVDLDKTKDLEAMTSTVQELNEQIEAKKMDLAPLVKSMQELLFLLEN